VNAAVVAICLVLLMAWINFLAFEWANKAPRS
jgi:hypothetical protein